MNRVAVSFVAAVIEAWQELRIHKLRVLLSLIGVCIAVTAMSSAAALGDIAQQTLRESNETQGRPALLSTYIYNPIATGPSQGPRVAQARAAFAEVAERFDITYWTISGYGNFTAQVGEVEVSANAQIVDVDYRIIRRVVIDRGRWMSAEDAQNRSPAVVINANLARKVGLSESSLPTTMTIRSSSGTEVDATVIGLSGSGPYNGDQGSFYLLYDTYAAWFGESDPLQDPGWEMWVPIPGAEELAADIKAALAAELPGYEVQTDRTDYLAWQSGEVDIAKWVVIGISAVILLLGALSLLNVTVISMGQRIREIGVRRSFGATTGRVFFSVVMESVVATTVAGVLGVMFAILIVNGPWTAKYLLDGIDDPPGFPFSAALLGIAVSLAVGVIAGVVPAVIAARVRIVNAIRFS